MACVSVALFLLGLADDFFHIKPYQKLIGQIVGAAAVVSAGLVLPWTTYSLGNLLITLFWIVGITNAVNMLDNMDGLAAGVSAIAAVFLGLNFVANLQWPEAVMLARSLPQMPLSHGRTRTQRGPGDFGSSTSRRPREVWPSPNCNSSVSSVRQRESGARTSFTA